MACIRRQPAEIHFRREEEMPAGVYKYDTFVDRVQMGSENYRRSLDRDSSVGDIKKTQLQKVEPFFYCENSVNFNT